MEGAAPVDQLVQEGPKRPLTDSSPAPLHDAFKPPPPDSFPATSLYRSPPTISPVTSSPDIPTMVKHSSGPIPVLSPLFLLPDYSSSSSTFNSTYLSTSQMFSTITSSTTTNLSGQDAPLSEPLPRSTPIIGSFSMSSQTLADPCSSSSLSSGILPPLSSSITHDQDLPSCSFVPPKSFLLMFLPYFLLIILHLQRGLRVVILSREDPLGVVSLGKNPQGGKERAPRPPSGCSHCFIMISQNLSSYQCPILPQGYLPGESALDLSTRPMVSNYSPQSPMINPFFTDYSCSPKILSPIISFNEPSEYVFNMFSFIYTCDFFPGQDNRSLLVSVIEW